VGLSRALRRLLTLLRHHDKPRPAKSARYTRSRRPVELVWFVKHRTRGAALKREYRIKQLARREKERLVLNCASQSAPSEAKKPQIRKPRVKIN